LCRGTSSAPNTSILIPPKAVDWLFVRAGEPHQLALLYPANDDAVEPADRAKAN